MKKYEIELTIFISIILVIFVANAIAVDPVQAQVPEPYFTLVFKTNSGGVRPDYGNLLKQQCARIGINIEVYITWWGNWIGELLAFRSFDICYVALTGGGGDPDFTGVYNENGSLNLFGYHTDMDYDKTLGTGINEWYMRQGNLIMPPDSEERIQHYWDWEQYLMDKILPCKPTFAPQSYTATWNNLDGYNLSDGILQSWGKMSFDGSHTGQISTSELVITDAAWSDLNPLFQDDTSSSFISSATMDPLIWYDADLSVWPHLAESYNMLNDTTLEINTRAGIKWATDPEGFFPNEYFDIKDVYFTFYAWKYLSPDRHHYDWIKDIEIIDEDTMIIYIDGDPNTPENEPYAPFLPAISKRMLPEHYLNQTQDLTGNPDITHSSWNTFATNCFGTGLFEIDTFKEGVETILKVRTDCWRLNTTITSDPNLNFVERFGDHSGNLETIRIRIIPDKRTALCEFEVGKVDIEGITTYPDIRDEYTLNTNFNIQSDTQFYFGFFGYNMRPVRPFIGSREPTKGDPSISIGLAVRKAISYAINRAEINNIIHRGEYTITDYPIYQKMGIWCNPNIIRYNHDLDKAREYLSLIGLVTINTPGFSMLITLSSLMLVSVASFVIIKRKK